MGYYLNSTDAYALYKNETRKPYFVDKTALLAELIPLVESGGNYICLTRPRRFGKSVAAAMIGAFFSEACDAHDIFDPLAIAESPGYGKHRNRHNVIYIDFSEMDDECRSYQEYIGWIKSLLREDLHAAYPDVEFRAGGSIPEDLKKIYAATGQTFLFVLDEWDAVFHAAFVTEKDKTAYLSFLKGLLKGKAYVSLAYMTGILPIAKYSSGSELNMFSEYTMATKIKYSRYFGFSEEEVDRLHERYIRLTEHPAVSRGDLREWYDGYQTPDGMRIYNPRSVVCALGDNQLGNYWTSSGPYDEIFFYIEKNVDEIRDDIAVMVSGGTVPAKVQEYAATSMELKTRDEILSAMVVYGFLSYENGCVSIPNKELMDRFADMIRKEAALGYVYRLAKESDRMLRATLEGDTETMLAILQYAHDTEVPLFRYRSETELTAIVNLVYLSARDSYRVEREDKAGTGYVDFIFYPVNPKQDGIILELKVDHSPEDAVRQIKERNYALRLRGRMGEKKVCAGRILAVGIAFDRKTKRHSCVVEEL